MAGGAVEAGQGNLPLTGHPARPLVYATDQRPGIDANREVKDFYLREAKAAMAQPGEHRTPPKSRPGG